MPLDAYRSKRDFARTPEPEPATVGEGTGRFVVQRHRASRLHYDLRLEIGGVLVSWALPRGPTLDPDERRMAMRTEDHPIEYLSFEGVIPPGQYGAGDMIVWDWGRFEPEETDDPAAGLMAGELKFRLQGERLAGRFTIVQTGGRRDAFGAKSEPGQWLLIHKRDGAAAVGWDPDLHLTSVMTGRTNDEVAAAVAARFMSPVPSQTDPSALEGAVPAPLPDFLPPMLATPVAGAFDDPEWLFEIKWDGYRVETVIHDGNARLWTRNRVDAAGYFPFLAGPAAWIDAREAVVDGEVVALDANGRPDFSLLQERTGLRGLEASTGRRTRASAPLSSDERVAIPLVYMVFDLLHLDGQSLLGVPLEERKRALHHLLRPHVAVRFSSHVIGDGRDFMEAARAQDLEGIVAKRRDSRYESGRRSRDWLKVKLRREQEFVVVGWLPGQGSTAELASVIVAVNHEGALRRAGQVGSGISQAAARGLLAELQSLRTAMPPIDPAESPPDARWVEPRLVVRAEFAEWTPDGVLRHPVFKGIAIGADPMAVVREESQPRAPAMEPRPATAQRPPAPASASEIVPASGDELAELDSMQGDGVWRVAGHEVRLTNLDKPIFPGVGGAAPLTKRDLIRHYAAVGAVMVPHLAGRGLTLQRFPNGIDRPGFWQKDLPGHAPTWVSRWSYAGHEGPKTYVVVDRVATLVWLAQEAAVELHPWTSRTVAPAEPTFALIDIDPGTGTSFDEVLVLARLFRTALQHLGVIGLPKVTGKRGIQVWIPIRPGYTFEQTRGWVESLSRAVGQMVPELVSWEWSKRDRGGRARLDFTQNAVNKTLVAPYSVRPAVSAPVSTPIAWSELDDPTLEPDRWTVSTLVQRLADVGDLFAPAPLTLQDLPVI